MEFTIWRKLKNRAAIRAIAIALAVLLFAAAGSAEVSLAATGASSQMPAFEATAKKASDDVATEAAITKPAISAGALQEAAAAQAYYMYKQASGTRRFVSNAGGYSFELPEGMEIKDMSHSSIVAVFEDEHRHLEVYSGTTGSLSGYVNYGYKFLSNTADYTQVYQSTGAVAGHTAYIKQWERKKLSKVANDHNYYASVTLSDGGRIYDFFFTSDLPFWQVGGFLDMPNSLWFFAPTSSGYDVVGKAVERPNWNEETAKFYKQYFTESEKLTWGMYNRYYSWTSNDLEKKEEEIGYKFPIALHYSSIRPDIAAYVSGISYLLDKAYSEGRTLELTLQTPMEVTGRNMMYRILDGELDSFLHDYAKAVAKFKHPVLFRPFNEMNGDWCNYSAYHTSRDTKIFRDVYKYLYGIFEEEGANANTIWVWNPNGKSYPSFAWNDQRLYYPGDEYVDIVGLTAYNTGNYYSGETWKSFNACYYNVYSTATRYYSQPMMITEFSCATAGGDKVSWVKNMFYYIKGYSKIKVAVWWDGCDFDANGNVARSYFIDDPREVMSVFKNYLSRDNEK